jgi:tetratricopeptide (TPR) repeat protein
MKPLFVRQKFHCHITVIIVAILLLTIPSSAWAVAEESPILSENTIADLAESKWMDGAPNRAMDIVEQGILENPTDLKLHKLRGDILATSRRDQQAVEAYDTVLQWTPDALDVRWAKWSVLLRSSQADQAISEFERIAQQDANNPLASWRLALELRKLDRLEESLEWYKKAVELRPELPGWRLAMARARFDVLDGRGARDEVNHVLKMVSKGSPEETAARSLLSVVYGATKERGRRFEAIFSPEGTAAQRKEWSKVRTEAWRLYKAGRFQEAEPLLRKSLELKPSDYGATYDLGRTLMELGQCDQAVKVFEKMTLMNPADLTYADTFFRIGQCKMELGQWDEALIHFEILYEAALEYELATKGTKVKGGQTVLDKEKIAKWIEKVRQKIPNAKSLREEAANLQADDPNAPPPLTEAELYEQIAKKRLKIDDPIYTRASLMGRDADFSLFRYVIPAEQVMRDDLPGGAHDFIPIKPGDTFPPTQEEIFLVFGLVTASYDEVPLTTQCFLETPKITKDQKPLAQDQIIMAMSEQTGYFVLSTPEAGWTPGLYVCGLYVGNEISAYTHADEVRFRIIEPTQQPSLRTQMSRKVAMERRNPSMLN